MADRPESGEDEPAGPGLDEASAYLVELTDGRRLTSEELAPVVYEDLQRIARRIFRGNAAQLTLQPTALVHEAYLKLAHRDGETWKSRAHFLSVAAVAMRRLLLNAARDRARLKRGGDRNQVTLSGLESGGDLEQIDALDLEEALTSLAKVNPRYARIAELRYFAGLTIQEVGQLLGVTKTVIDRDWVRARAWLALRLESR
ncbi:MAG: ECF-type sigma factor [Planctomycetota bacterium]